MIAILVFGSLEIQTTINLDRDGSPLAAFALLFRYFTIWSNFAAGMIMGWIAFGKRMPSWVLFALPTALTVVALVYHALLSSTHHPVGLDVWTNQMFHTAIPLATVLFWLVNSLSDGLTWRSIPVVMIAPLIYTGFALIYGEQSGFYPYFFLELPKIGWGELAINIVGLGIFFMLLGSALLGLRRLVSHLTQRPRLSTR